MNKGELYNLITEYCEKWKIKPINVKKYLDPGSKRFNNFLLRNKLNESDGFILKNIIEKMEKDILKFNDYNLLESNDYKINDIKEVLYKGIEKADIKMEKIIADQFDTNLSDIDIINSEKHIFRLKIWNDITFIIAYSEEEFKIITENLIEHLTNEISKKEINLINDVSIPMNDILSGDKTYQNIKKLLTESLVKDIISNLLGAYEFETINNGYYLWKFKD